MQSSLGDNGVDRRARRLARFREAPPFWALLSPPPEQQTPERPRSRRRGLVLAQTPEPAPPNKPEPEPWNYSVFGV